MSRQQRITRHLRKTLNTREYKTTGSKKGMWKKQTMEVKKTNLYTQVNYIIFREKINGIHETRKIFSEEERSENNEKKFLGNQHLRLPKQTKDINR